MLVLYEPLLALEIEPFTVFMSILLMIAIMVGFAAAGGLLAGFIGGTVFKRIREKKGILVKEIIAETTEAVESEEALEPSV